MKKIILTSDNVQDITVEEVAGDFVLYQGDDIVVIDKEQIAQLVAAQQSEQAEEVEIDPVTQALRNLGDAIAPDRR